MEFNQFPPELKAAVDNVELEKLKETKQILEKRLTNRPISGPMRLILEGTIANLDRKIEQVESAQGP